MLVSFQIISFVLFVAVQCQNPISITNQFVDNACVTVQSSVQVNGHCIPIVECPSILVNIRKSQYDHTVCGYEGKMQIVCCPESRNMTLTQLQNLVQLNINKNVVQCRITNTNEIGFMKFLHECPELQGNGASVELNRFCDTELCSDLVCCPVKLKNRLKEVCWHVDHPFHTLELRLLQNIECTIKELNLKGRYQTKCDYAERNPHLKSMLRKVCNDAFCNDWFCCPLKDDDKFYCSAHAISSKIGKLVGPKCVDSRSGRKGTCRPKYHCYQPTNMLVSTPLDSCGSYCCSEFHCCPDDFDPSQFKSIAERECFSHSRYLARENVEVPMSDKLFCSAGGAGGAGGTVVNPGDYPHMVALGYESSGEVLWNCGGSLISNRFVLTAGHCLTSREYGQVIKARLGVIDLFNDINTRDCPEEFDVARTIAHPEYDPRYVYNDIGLVELIGQVKFNFHIRPICLPTNSDLPDYFNSMGWGAVGPAEEKSVKLIKVEQVLFTFEECQELYQYNINRRLNRGVLNETQICAGSRDSIQSTCEGDSGGPLLRGNDNIYGLFYVYGIVSFGTACGFANSPGIYTKVFPYVKWVEGIVWND